MKKALVFGGSFDPPHAGHMNLLKNAIHTVGPNEVFIVPSGTAPHKRRSETPGEVRAAMCECFRPLFPSLVVSRIELERPGRSFTCDTLRGLRGEYPGRDWFLLVGADMLESFASWHRWREVLALATLVAAGRAEGQQPELDEAARHLREAGGRVLFAEGPVVAASSSAIRVAVAAGEDAFSLIPPPADAIVRERGLYTAPTHSGDANDH